MTTDAPVNPVLKMRKQVAWDNHQLVVVDVNLIDSARRKALSASTAKAMDSCQSRWLGERMLKDEEENPFDPAPLGTSAHLVLERFYDLPAESRTDDQLMILVLTYADEFWGTDVHGSALAEKHRWVGEVHRRVQNISQMENPQEVVVHSTEFELSDVVVEGAPFIGFIDRVDIVTDENGIEGIQLVDYKAGKVPKNITMFGDDHGDQMRIYAEAYYRKFGVRPTHALLYYTTHNQVKRVALSKSSMTKTLKAFKTSWNTHNTAMDTARFGTKPSALCGWCPLVNSCPSAIKKDGTEYVARIEGLPSAEDLSIPILSERVDERESAYDNTEEPIFEDSVSQDWTIQSDVEDDLEQDNDAPKKGAKETTSRSTKEIKMSRNVKGMFGPESKPWEESDDGRLNPNSYSATAVFGTVASAINILSDNKQQITPRNVRAVTGTLSKVILDAQIELEGSVDWNSGLNTRLRGALHSTVETLPLPFGGEADDWESWISTATRRVLSIASVASALYMDFDPESAEPWVALCSE